MFSPSRVVIFVLCAWLTWLPLAHAQSRLIGDTYTFSSTNFPSDVGTTEDPVTGEIIDHGTDAVELTIDGIAEVAGGMRVNERIVDWPGVPGGILAIQESGYDGEVEWDLIEWENAGEVIEFSFETVDGEWISESPSFQSTATLRGLDWANSAEDAEPWFFDTGFYLYWTVDGEPLTGYTTLQPDLGVLVGEHPFDPSIPEVAYIWFDRNQVEETTRPYEGGVDLLIGTTELNENQGSWALLAQVLSLNGLAEINGKAANGFFLGMLIDPPAADANTVVGDYNGNLLLDAPDLDQQAEVAKGLRPFAPEYDLNADDVVDGADRLLWLRNLKKTWVGDANLDFEFNTQDFVDVFQAGLYETGQRAGWAQGDWDGDLLFDTADFVVAFTEAGYEKGPYPQDAAVRAVPEPQGLLLISLAAGMLLARRKR